jgi:isoaspartyl peptidase/L-asparaginase-like protein (Ntn-hydrolase superfamily)
LKLAIVPLILLLAWLRSRRHARLRSSSTTGRPTRHAASRGARAVGLVTLSEEGEVALACSKCGVAGLTQWDCPTPASCWMYVETSPSPTSSGATMDAGALGVVSHELP